MYVLGTIHVTKTERGLAFQLPNGGLQETVEVVLPAEPDEVFVNAPDGAPAMAVCFPESRELGIFLVRCGVRAPVLKEKIGLLQRAVGSVAFRDLGLEIVALDEGPDVRLNRSLAQVLFGRPAGTPSRDSRGGKGRDDRVVIGLDRSKKDEVFELEVLPLLEDMEVYNAIRLFCCQGGQRVTLWTRAGDRRLASEALVLQVGARFKARVVNRVDDNLEIDSIEVLEEEAA